MPVDLKTITDAVKEIKELLYTVKGSIDLALRAVEDERYSDIEKHLKQALDDIDYMIE